MFDALKEFMNSHDMSKWGFEFDGPVTDEAVNDLLEALQLPDDPTIENEAISLCKAAGFPKLKRPW